jgi:hypothetical protein
MAAIFFSTNPNQNELAITLRHEGIRVGEIIAYRAWRVIKPGWWGRSRRARSGIPLPVRQDR